VPSFKTENFLIIQAPGNLLIHRLIFNLSPKHFSNSFDEYIKIKVEVKLNRGAQYPKEDYLKVVCAEFSTLC
jgi:hypothetical protein